MQPLIRKLTWFSLLTFVLLMTPGFACATNITPGSTPGQDISPGQENPQAAEQTPSFNDCALFIAGLSDREGTQAAAKKDSTWTRYARSFNQTWARFEKSHLAPMRAWASRELGTATATIFYPFSGPDFANMYTLFPRAKTYLMVALEPVGKIPDFSAINEEQFFAGLQRSLYELLQINFFVTEKLKTSLQEADMKGILPVLLFFLSREQTRVLDVRYWVMKPDGAIEESSATGPRKLCRGDIPGVRIDFVGAPSDEPQTLYYFRFNLRNNFLQQNQQFVAFLKSFGPLTTFAKAASYLMHKPDFSEIRQFILDQSLYVLQGDSAIPVKYFDPGVWHLRFYGNYTAPITLFKNRQQQDLAEIYKKGAGVYPLPFGIDYRHRVKTSNLMFASKKVDGLANDLK